MGWLLTKKIVSLVADFWSSHQRPTLSINCKTHTTRLQSGNPFGPINYRMHEQPGRLARFAAPVLLACAGVSRGLCGVRLHTGLCSPCNKSKIFLKRMGRRQTNIYTQVDALLGASSNIRNPMFYTYNLVLPKNTKRNNEKRTKLIMVWNENSKEKKTTDCTFLLMKFYHSSILKSYILTWYRALQSIECHKLR